MSRNRTTSARIAAGSAVAVGASLLAGLAPTAAFAAAPSPAASAATTTCQPAELAAVKAHAAAAVSRRDSTLTTLATRLADRPAVTATHRATLTALYANDRTGLDAVNAKVQADSTCRSAHADAQAIVQDYRVYLLVVPQSGLTRAADVGTAGAKALIATEPALQKAIALLPAGPTKEQAQTLYADLVTQAGAAEQSLVGVGDTVLALTPAGYPGNAGTLVSARASVATGGTELARAVKDAQQLAALFG